MQWWLHGTLNDEKRAQKISFSLLKYWLRTQSRCTPFGLFASCGTGRWNEVGEVIIQQNDLRRKTKFDMNFVCQLSRYLSQLPELESRLLFYPNNSIYSSLNQLRYVEYKYVNNRRSHTISQVDKSEYLSEILHCAGHGATIQSLVNVLVHMGIRTSEACEFVQELIEYQILSSELEPAITGSDPLGQVENVINKIAGKINSPELLELLSLITKVRERFNVLDHQFVNDASAYKQISDELKNLNLPMNEKYLFHVDSFSHSKNVSVSAVVQKELINAIDFLNVFNTSAPNPELEEFKTRFFDRYERREISLLELMDPETGLGYPLKEVHGINPIIDDLGILGKGTSDSLTWNSKQTTLLRRLVKAISNNETVVTFSKEDFGAQPETINLAPTFTVMFRVIDNARGYVQLNGIGVGSSAANLLARFAYGSEDIFEIAMDVTKFEEQAYKNKIVAEIVHLPESRTGNVLLRPVLRDYEIPYLAKSGVAMENQIGLEDLLISVKHGRIILRSKRLNKEIIPRLSTAHNFSFNSLPVYRFLCDLQFQDIDKPSLAFHWGSMSELFPFLPRVEYGNVVLSPCTWHLTSSDFENLCKNITSESFIEEVSIWRNKWNMPRRIVLIDGDNELLVDFESDLNCKVFFNEIKSLKKIQLAEYLFDPEIALIRDEIARPYTNEVIAVVFNEEFKSVPTPELSKISNASLNNRFFLPGSEWLFYKIYCGVKSADDVLRFLHRITGNLVESNLIQKWFFIRYSDPDNHIRLRFYQPDLSKLQETSAIVMRSLEPLFEQGVISKIQTDTYSREIERYGSNSIEHAESFFFIDSQAVVAMLDVTKGQTEEEARWEFALTAVNDLLNYLEPALERKLMILDALKTGFTAEHGGTKELNIQLDTKFRKMRSQLETLLSASGVKNDHSRKILSWRLNMIQPIITEVLEMKENSSLLVPLAELFSSFSHMTINRIFKARQRTYEMVIYDHLYKYYKSLDARNKKAVRTNL